MKRFSFAGVVGLLAFCASIAVSGGYFEKKERLGVGNCFRPDPFWGMQLKSQSCITGPYAVTPSTSCAAVWTYDKVYASNTGLFPSMITILKENSDFFTTAFFPLYVVLI